ncbi:MAG: type VI secretion system tip protein VgrG [Planctomycetaceae bacterium]
MATYTQDDRPISVETPLGKDALLLNAFSGEERMSGLFSFSLDMLSPIGGHKAADIVGHAIDFQVRDAEGTERWFNGVVNSFSYNGQGDRLHIYKAHVVPWLWFLTRSSDCKVFSEMDVQTIVTNVLQELGFSDFMFDLKRPPEVRTYCVQYRETHFDFVTRLLAEEGIFYYFKHEKGKHKLVMTDHVNGVYDCPESEVQLLSNLSAPEITDQLSSWSHDYEYVSGKWAHTHYDFENPSSSQLKQTNGLVSVKDNSKREFFDYPYAGHYGSFGGGEALVKLRMEQEESAYETITCSSDRRSFSPGGRFTVTKHHNSAEAGSKWYLTVVQHHASLGGSYVSGVAHDENVYHNNFKAMPDNVVFRPAGGTQKPRVFGLHSAVVVGPSGEEIYTDEYGRIKVQFHWDRYGAKDDKSSCWVRVATPWAGEQWGMVHIPRIGQEVLVDFLEGDPDRPVVMASVYNAEQMPPYGLPDNKTQSGIKSRSSKGGAAANFNEIRFEDKKGAEQIYMHAERNLDTVVENNETRKVGFDDKEDGNQDIEIYNDQNLKVGKAGCKAGSQTVDIYKDRTVTIETGNDTLNIKSGNSTTTLDKGDMTITLKMGNLTQKINMGKSTQTAMKSIELKCGASSIKLEPAKITMRSIEIDINASVQLKAKGSAMATFEAGGMNAVKGGLVKIN